LKILKQERTGSNVKLEVEADLQEYKNAFDSVMEEAGRSIKVPGFRPGKAPRNILEQNINADFVKERALEQVIRESLPAIIKESGLEVIEIQNWAPVSLDGQCVFSLEVVVQPEVSLGKYKGVQAGKKQAKVEDSQIDEYIRSVLAEAAQVKEISGRPVKTGDIAELDVEGQVNGKPEDALSQKSLPVLIGDNRIAPGFDGNIEGLSIGEGKEFNITLPADYYVKEFSGAEALFKVTVKRIAERTIPELSDEFVKKISSFNSVEEYKSDVRKRFEDAVKREAEDHFKDELLKKVLEGSVVEIPDAVTRRETDIMLDEMNVNLEQKGLSLDHYLKSRQIDLNSLRKELEPKAADRAKAKLVLRAVAKQEGLEATVDDLENEIKKISEELGRPPEDYRGEMMKEYLKDFILRTKALDFIAEHAKIK